MAELRGVSQLLHHWDDPPSIGRIPGLETIEIRQIFVVSKEKKTSESGKNCFGDFRKIPATNTSWTPTLDG